jgi:hypothetical protein
LKTGISQGIVSSNLTASALKNGSSVESFFVPAVRYEL